MTQVFSAKVGEVLTCLVCGQETQVSDIPLAAIREASLEAVSSLCDSLDWVAGLRAVARCQALHDRHMPPPSLELYNTQISIWRALWMIVGNKKIKKGII